MTIRNRTSVGWLTAQAERLKRFIALSKDDPIAKKRQPLCSTRRREAAKQSRGLGRFWIASPLQPQHLRLGRNSPRNDELVNSRKTVTTRSAPFGPDRASARQVRRS